MSEFLDWAMTLKPQYIEAIRKGIKRYEVRTWIPRELYSGDSIYVVQSASGGRVVLRLVVDGTYRFTVPTAWALFCHAFGMTKKEYEKYTQGQPRIFLIRFSKFEEMPEDMTIRDLGLKRAPQWFQRIQRK